MRGEPAEEELSESECLRDGREVSLARVGRRELGSVGGELELWLELEDWVTSIGW